MSYSLVESAGSLGFIYIPVASAGTCDGDLFDDDDDCCPKNTWSHAAYIEAKGSVPFQYWNERRVRSGLQELTSPVGDYATGIEALAYDQKGFADPIFVARLRKAYANYLAAYPANRWFWKEDSRQHECAEDGYFGVWDTKVVAATVPRVQLLSALSRTRLTASDVGGERLRLVDASFATPGQRAPSLPGQKGKGWDEVPVDYLKWARAANQIINSVPTRGSYNSGPWVPDFYRVATGGKVVASEWTTTFMDLFDPAPQANLSRAMANSARLLQLSLVTSSSAIQKAAEAARRTRPKPTTIKSSVAYRLRHNISDDDERPKVSRATVGAAAAVAGTAAFALLRYLAR